MSLSIDPKNGVKLKPSRKPGRGIAAVIIVLEAVFSIFLYMSLAERIFVVAPAGAAAGVPDLVAYQGLLTDTSGNPLGGAGSVYCFRYSMWDSQSGGNQIWPLAALGDASSTPSNSTTTVTDGVFSDELGRTDTFGTLDFGADTTGTSTYYLQVQVSTSSLTCASGVETLSPRQQITSDAWSQTAQSVYGNQLRTLNATNIVQVGTGGGVTAGSQTLLSLDVVNVSSSESIGGSCSQNGTLWYDSSLKRALVCENSTIQPISNGSTSVTSVGTSGTSTLLFNNIFLSAVANITLSQTGQTINISAPNPGAGSTLSYWANLPDFQGSTVMGSTSGQSVAIAPFVLPQAISASYIRIPVSVSLSSVSAVQVNTTTNSSTTFSMGRYETDAFVLYTQNVGGNSLSLASIFSGSATWSAQTIYSATGTGVSLSSYSVSINIGYPVTGSTSNYASTYTLANSSYVVCTGSLTNFSGTRFLDIPFASSLSAGDYWIGLGRSTSTAGNAGAALSAASIGLSAWGVSQPAISFGLMGVVTASSTATAQVQIQPGLGYVTTNVNIMSTANVALSNITNAANNPEIYFQFIRDN